MQHRHTDRSLYFHEQKDTSCKYYANYVSAYMKLSSDSRILEVGCGEGGNLVPFSQAGCYVKGVDIAAVRIAQAEKYFLEMGLKADFVSEDFLEMEPPRTEKERFDIVLLHDVIEHVAEKTDLLTHVKQFLKKGSIVFIAFPAWRMPFGGHQQICRSPICSHLPFIHLLPLWLYRVILWLFGEEPGVILELTSIKSCRMDISKFESLVHSCGYIVRQRTLWLVNPHYEQKFKMHPRRLPVTIAKLPYLRDFFSTSCWYVLSVG